MEVNLKPIHSTRSMLPHVSWRKANVKFTVLHLLGTASLEPRAAEWALFLILNSQIDEGLVFSWDYIYVNGEPLG